MVLFDQKNSVFFFHTDKDPEFQKACDGMHQKSFLFFFGKVSKLPSEV